MKVWFDTMKLWSSSFPRGTLPYTLRTRTPAMKQIHPNSLCGQSRRWAQSGPIRGRSGAEQGLSLRSKVPSNAQGSHPATFHLPATAERHAPKSCASVRFCATALAYVLSVGVMAGTTALVVTA